MPRVFSGLVICDEEVREKGRMLSHNAPHLHARILEPFDFSFSPADIDGNVSAVSKSIFLEWNRGIRLTDVHGWGERDISFWIPAGRDLSWAIDKLLSSYTEQARKEERR